MDSSISNNRYTAREKLQTLSRHVVWKAEFEGRTVALKEYRVDAAALKTCYHEAALLHKCHHPAVAELEALFESDGFLYLQMPYYSNGTLSTHVSTLHDRATLSPACLLGLMLPLSQAMAHLDALGVLHSDIKPDNILIDKEMRPRLADFDVSVPAAMRRSCEFAKSTMIGGGTVGFIAPEVLKGGVKVLTGKADVYSLGKSFEEVLPAAPNQDYRPLMQLLKRMTDEKPEARPTAAEVALQAADALAKVVQLEAERAQKKFECEFGRLDTPSYWTGRGASPDGFTLISLQSTKDHEAWQALSEMIQTDGSLLGHGTDHKHKSPPYNRLQLAAAWRIEHRALWHKYAGGRQTVALGLQRVLQAGKPQRDADPRLHGAGLRLPGGLNAEAGEEFLLHGTQPSMVLSILSTGLNEHFAGTSAGTAFGDGLYFAEDAGKNDHYVTMDKETATRSSDTNKTLHERLYNSASHPGRVFYLLVCRVATGYIVRTQKSLLQDINIKSADTGEPIFPKIHHRVWTRELTAVTGVNPPVIHHTLLAEDHARGGSYRYREFVVFQNANVYPEYLIAYQRFHNALGPQ